MSRGFVKEDDQEEVPLVPPRADLPIGTENFVTQNGMNSLLEEREELFVEQENLDSSQEKEYRISFNHLNAKLQLLNERIASAKIVDPKKLPQDEIHFGAKVTFKNGVPARINFRYLKKYLINLINVTASILLYCTIIHMC